MHGKTLLIILFGFFAVASGHAQQSLSVSPGSIGVTATDVGTSYFVDHDAPPRAIAFHNQTVTAAQFLSNTNTYLNVPAEFTFAELESNTDELGMRHHHLQQYYNGIPIEGMVYRAHQRNGFMVSANGRAVRSVNLDMQSPVSEEQAFFLAVQNVKGVDSIFRKGKKLIVSKNFSFAPKSFYLAYQFDIDVSVAEHWRVSIDAASGQLINKVNLVNSCGDDEPTPPLPYGTGYGMTNYYGMKPIPVEYTSSTSTRLRGQTENGGLIQTFDFRNVSILSLTIFYEFHTVYDFYSNTNTYYDAYQSPAASVQWAATQAYEYYLAKHNRNSYDNNGSVIKSYVHVDRNMNNAYWTRNLLAIGDGDNNNPLVELDIVAHELTHGVTQYEAGLVYSNESGALNESFSDIFGKAVEFHAMGSNNSTWQVGRHYREGGIRDMSNPNQKSQPDTYLGQYWYTGYEDSGGVHINSGVQNFWYYLLCNGGSGENDRQYSYTVNAIGMDAATKIAYRNLTEYLGNVSDYFDSRIGSLLAAADLYGQGSSIYQEVAKAWDAVGVIEQPIITSVETYDITGTTVRIKGTLIPRGNTVTYQIEYGKTPAYGSTSAVFNYGDGVNCQLTGLEGLTKYYFRLVATNENGSSYHASQFTTISLSPLARVKQTVDVSETTATLYGEVNPNSLPTNFYFEYGPTPALGQATPSQLLPNMTEYLPVAVNVEGLTPRQTYYYRLVAVNSNGPRLTNTLSFFTATKPVINSFSPVAAAVNETLTITGRNFNTTLENNVVYFGATRANVLSSTSEELKVQVPSGASFGPITVVDKESGLADESSEEFIPTYAGEFSKYDMHLNIGINDPIIWNTIVKDMDGDKRPDIIGVHYQGFSIYQNAHQGGPITSESFARSTFSNTEITYSTFFTVDMDGNGLPDLVFQTRNGLLIYPNRSIAGYLFFDTPVSISMSDVTDLALSDFDNDGHIDIVGIISVPVQSSIVTIVRNKNPKDVLMSANFEMVSVKHLPYIAEFLTTGDVDNDGLTDLIISTRMKDFFAILRNQSSPGTFSFKEETVNDPTANHDFMRYVAYDITQTGLKDIIAHSPYRKEGIGILNNNGTTSTLSFSRKSLPVIENKEAVVCPADVNGDGKLDFVAGFRNRTFSLLGNTTESPTNPTFGVLGTYGFELTNSNTAEPKITVNDLDGDGRPEIINVYSYNYGPHDYYRMEIWQNAPQECPDPSLVKVEAKRMTATIILPENMTIDDYDIDYSYNGYDNWIKVASTNLYLYGSLAYKLRVRAKCYLLYTDYHITEFTMDCVDSDSFQISDVGSDKATFSASDLSQFELAYSPAGKNEWIDVRTNQYSVQVTNLLPGTIYDVRFRGRCTQLRDYHYVQFSTTCPGLYNIYVNDVTYERASVNWTAYRNGSAVLEYSTDSVTWTHIADEKTLFPLTPNTEYVVRGYVSCNDLNSDYMYALFKTPCPEVTKLGVNMITPFGAMVSWEDHLAIGSYTVTYKSPRMPSKSFETSRTWFEISGLEPGTHYEVSVAPHCTGAKAFKEVEFNTVCYAPLDMVVSNVTYTSADFSWRDDYDVLPYDFDYAVAGSNKWTTIQTYTKKINLTDLRPAAEYQVRVHVNCPDVLAPYITFTFETNRYGETVVAPNPTDGKFVVYPAKNLIGNRYVICDNTGRILLDGNLTDYAIDLGGLSPGFYILKIDGENAIKISKQ